MILHKQTMRKLFIILVILTTAIAAMAQTLSRRAWRNVAMDAYVHTVYSMYQDHRGLVWIGTSQGLFRYDGYGTHYIDALDERAGSQFYSMIERNDTLYLGTNNGLLLLDMMTERYIPISNNSPSEIRAMVLDGDCIWIGSLNGLYRYTIGTGNVARIVDGLPHSAVYALLRSREGDIYVGTYDGLCRYNRDKSRLEPIEVGRVGTSGNIFVNSLAEDTVRRCIWIGTEGALLRYDKETHMIDHRRILSQNSVKVIAIDGSGIILAGTDAGLYILSDDACELARHDSRLSKSIANNVVWSVMVDRYGNYWAGTEQDFSVSCNNAGFTIVPLSEITERGDGNRLYCMLRDSQDVLWLGGSNGIIRYTGNPTASQWYMSGDSRYPLSHNRVRDIYEDSSGVVWIATDGSVNHYDTEGGRWINHRLTDSSHHLNANWAYSIFEDDSNQLWVGSYLGGIFIADRNRLMQSTDMCIADAELNTSTNMPNNFINQMEIDSQGNKWVLLFRDNSLLRIANADAPILHIDVKGAVGSSPSHLVCDSDDGVWCGYAGGIVRVSADGTIGEPIGFPMKYGENLLAMAQVGGEIWVSTDDGVWAVDRRTHQVKLLPLPAKAYTCIYYDSRKNRVLLGSVDEYTNADPAISSTSSSADSLYITGLYVNETPRVVSVENFDRLTLPYDENNLIIEFSDLRYSLDNRGHYEYRLTGSDRAWTLLDEEDNKIVLSGLSPGDYLLEIRQAHGDDSDSFVLQLSITITPPWYASWWSILLYIILGIVVAVWCVRYFRNRARLQLERMERERTLQAVRQRMDFLTGVSHEFKTPLSMIIGPLSKLLSETRDTRLRRSLDMVYTNAMKLNSLVHSALEINRIEDNTEHLLIYSRVDIVEFCKSIFDSYQEAFPTKHFIFTSTADHIITEADVVKMESILNNLLSNACKYSSDDSTIALSIVRDESRFVLNVSDDGVGIPESERQLIFHRHFRSLRTAADSDGSGIGLYLVKQYVEMHSGTIEVSGNEDEGTTFTVAVPLREPVGEEESREEALSVEDGRFRILIVDDNISIAAFIKEILSEEYFCVTAINGRAALAVCAGMMPDLIIADEMMPVMSGLEMCRRLKSNPKTAVIPIIILTDKDDSATEAESIKIGVDTFMPKPFEAPMLQAQVRRLLEAKASMRAEVRVEQLTAARPIEAESVAERQLAQVSQIIDDNISDTNLNVSFVCEKTGMQSKQLYRLIKKYMGVSPVEHIKQIRLRKAAMLLDQHKFSVSEVMYMVGFSSSSYFSKCFLSQYGCTPRQYAERQNDM